MERNLVLAPFHVDTFGTGGRETDQILLECPRSLSVALSRLLFAMKVKRNIKIEQYDSHVWSLVPQDTSMWQEHMSRIPETSSEDMIVSRDPRLPFLGYRILSSLPIDSFSGLRSLLGLQPEEIEEASLQQYTKFRFRLGIGEGEVDHPEGLAYPLECNADFLNGLSFRKGMFTGDWVTGRNYRKGVKTRIMPIAFPDLDSKQLDRHMVAPWTELSFPDGEPIGIIRNRVDTYAIAAIQQRPLFNKCLKDKSFGKEMKLIHTISGLPVLTWIPFWWQSFDRRLPSSETRVTSIPDGKQRISSLNGDSRFISSSSFKN